MSWNGAFGVSESKDLNSSISIVVDMSDTCNRGKLDISPSEVGSIGIIFISPKSSYCKAHCFIGGHNVVHLANPFFLSPKRLYDLFVHANAMQCKTSCNRRLYQQNSVQATVVLGVIRNF